MPAFAVEAPLVLLQAPALLVQLLLADQVVLHLSLLPLPLQVLLLALQLILLQLQALFVEALALFLELALALFASALHRLLRAHAIGRRRCGLRRGRRRNEAARPVANSLSMMASRTSGMCPSILANRPGLGG